MEVADKIRKLRVQKGYSQEYLADRLGISQKTYSNIEAGKSRLDIRLLDDLAEVLEVGVEELLFSDKTINQVNKDNAVGYGYVETLHILSEKLIEQYEKRIELLEKEIENLKKQIN